MEMEGCCSETAAIQAQHGSCYRLFSHSFIIFDEDNEITIILSISATTQKKRKKSVPSHKAHRAALISVSLALSQTPVYTANTRIRG